MKKHTWPRVLVLSVWCMWLVCVWVCGWCMCEDMIRDVLMKVGFVFVWECAIVLFKEVGFFVCWMLLSVATLLINMTRMIVVLMVSCVVC